MGGRGGSLTNSHAAPAVPQPAVLAQQPSPTSNQPSPAVPQPAVQAQQPAPASSRPPTGHNFPDLTLAQQQALLQMQRPRQDQAALLSIKDYTDATPQSNGYALSQNTNHALENGHRLTAQQRQMASGLKKLMGPIGAEATLYRADHDDILKRLGVSNYSGMTTSQLRQALVGQTWTAKGFTSTAHSSRMNPFWPGGSSGGGREVLMKLHTSRTVRAALVQRRQAEVLLDTGTHFRITSVKMTGAMAHPRTGGRKPVIEIEAEVW